MIYRFTESLKPQVTNERKLNFALYLPLTSWRILSTNIYTDYCFTSKVESRFLYFLFFLYLFLFFFSLNNSYIHYRNTDGESLKKYTNRLKQLFTRRTIVSQRIIPDTRIQKRFRLPDRIFFFKFIIILDATLRYGYTCTSQRK